MRSVSVLVLPDTMASVLLGAMDVFSAAGVAWGRLTGGPVGEPLFKPTLVGLDENPVMSFNGVVLQPQQSLAAVDNTDIVFVPPFWLAPYDTAYLHHTALFDWLQRMASGGALLTSACTGSLLLAAAGLLDGCAATTHWAFADTMRRHHPRVVLREEDTLVESRGTFPTVTAGGHAAWQGLLLHLIRREGGDEAALQVAKLFLLQWQVHGQRPYAAAVGRRAHEDALIHAAQDFLAQHHAKADALDLTRGRTSLTTRTFFRRFKLATGQTPIDYLQALRIEVAKACLEQGREPVETIADDVGYQDISFFRRLFKRRVGLTPAAYRRKFRLLDPVRIDT